MILEVKNLYSGYPGRTDVIRNVSLDVNEGEIVVLMGHNGAGKTTLLNTIFGLLRPESGDVLYDGSRIRSSSQKVRSGMSYCIQGQGILPSMSVMDNLDIAVLSLSIDSRQYQQRLETVFGLFSVLDERRNQRAGTMSGGQQRMLSIGMALMQAPKLLLLDEPSLGLSPILIEEIFNVIRSSRDKLGLSILLVEQNVKYAVHLADRVCILKMGEVVCAGEPAVLLNQINLWDNL